MATAACVATASEREGYGLVVVEAAARATPSVVVDGPENAATELVEDGVNGIVAPSAAPADLARSLLRVVEAGPALRESTGRWFEENAGRLTLDRSLKVVVAEYQGVRAEDAFQPHAV
jgi:glycosyltransferase involved in cell wall biosynthesis